MRRSLTVAAVLAILCFSCVPADDPAIDVMTFNIRLDTPHDGPNAWPHRAAMVAGFVNDRIPDLLGMQEVLWHQYEYLDSALTGYGSVVAGRDDGLRAGEACPVFFRLGRFDMLDKGTFWLSATPEVPGSIGWGAALTRVATWVRLYDRTVRDTLLFMNTHFDHISDSARVMSSGVLMEKVRELAGDYDFIITGDFNARPESLAIAGMLEGGLIVDTYLITETAPAGESYTFNGWKDQQGEGRIDYIFVRSGMKALSHATHRVIENGVFISDHWPVTARVRGL
ncbi:MAG: endonuclease/exonuclease/phosphatase family protein [Bacteroidales bacterium]|nr:endonuclease/exonuclease/phosphatase family protein [Bacteroidales bacterium]MDT8374333.1 endonuclease/exonuclease/phosphatase family protein [Bacteroidales bacterium]